MTFTPSSIQTDGDKKARSHRLESELLMLQSDKGRLERNRETIVTDLRKMKNDLTRLKLDIDAKEQADRSALRDIALIDTEIARVRKQMNSL